ncbi:hypothetical protein [Geomonas sp.]|uniref:hypothetical protein n=1 Tax=Geomonas sp. TaxID=2651584 RepID=UPI002B466B9A|nr:hypothetical protein [Geomonas sp.]HJV36787.1 hypothetical protein [Geomonas sp.]
MLDENIAYIKTEPMPADTRCQHVNTPHFRCTIELIDGSTIMRCGETELHALANAMACYKTSPRFKEAPSSSSQ